MNKELIAYFGTTNDVASIDLIKQLDFMLDFFIERPDSNTKDSDATAYMISNYINSISENKYTANQPKLIQDILLIVNQLCDDKYISYSSYTDPTFGLEMERFYKITFKGRLFHQRGGYRGEDDRRNADVGRRAMEVQRNKYLLLITFAIGVGTIVAAFYYAFYLFDYYNQHSLNWNFCAYFLTGLVTGLLIWLSTWLLLQIFRKT